MAQLFDRRRFSRLSQRTFNAALQLPMISDLDPTSRRRMAISELSYLVRRFPDVSASGVVASAIADPFNVVDFEQKVGEFHLVLLERLVDNPVAISAYHLGIALSDLCWNHTRDAGPDSFLEAFSRSEIVQLQVLLRVSSPGLPPLAAATVSKSLEKWQDWADVTAPRLRSGDYTGWSLILPALRHQGNIWHALLTAAPLEGDEESPDPTRVAILRRLRFVLIVAALTAIVLYFTITKFSGSVKVWTTVGTITAVLGVTGASLLSAARKAVDAFGWDPQTTAKAEARVWSVTLLPALALSALQRRQLMRRSGRLSAIRKNIDF